MCELNAIELAWAKVKHLIRENNIASDLPLKVLEEKTRAAVGQVMAEDWAGY
jgi:transposase